MDSGGTLLLKYYTFIQYLQKLTQSDRKYLLRLYDCRDNYNLLLLLQLFYRFYLSNKILQTLLDAHLYGFCNDWHQQRKSVVGHPTYINICIIDINLCLLNNICTSTSKVKIFIVDFRKEQLKFTETSKRFCDCLDIMSRTP